MPNAINSITLPVDKGCATGVDPTLLEPGKMSEAEGVAYETSDPAAHKVGGRVRFDTSAPSANNVGGIAFNSFDNGNDYVTYHINGTLYSAQSTVGTPTSIRTGLTPTATQLDRVKFFDDCVMCNGNDRNWVHKSDNTTIALGMFETAAPTSSFLGTGLTGTFTYWYTEYDSVNNIESSTSVVNGYLTGVAPANQTVRITRGTQLNSNTTHWKLYRTINNGVAPTGWLVATVVWATSTYDDTTQDATLVLNNTPYPIIAPNDIPEPRNVAPPGGFRSLATFEGSLVGCGTTSAPSVNGTRAIFYSETSLPHYFPTSYVIPFRPHWGGQARCARQINKILLVFFDHETFRVNTLPKAADSFFDIGVVQEHIGNYGTPSPLGACRFSGWGGTEMCFFASRSNPMLTDGNAFDQAVGNIDWQATVPATSLSTCVCIDNPDRYRIEMFFLDAQGDWRALHFYYHTAHITTEAGFPELAWTGPHLVPGPGSFGILNGDGFVWTGSEAGDGKVYREEVGYSDAANLYDSNGTVPFRLTTGQVYAEGINSQAVAYRMFVSKHGTSTGTYSVSCNWHHEGDEIGSTTHTIDATQTGATSNDFTRHFQSVAMRIVRDDAVFMPPINNVTIQVKDVGEFVKANRR